MANDSNAPQTLLSLKQEYERTRAFAERRKYASALKRAGDWETLIVLYEPLLAADNAHREEFLEESYIRETHQPLLAQVLELHDQSGLRTHLHGDALKRTDYTTINLAATTPPRARIPFDTRMNRLERLMRYTFGLDFHLHKDESTHLYHATIPATPIQLTYHKTPENHMPPGRTMRI